MRKFFNRLIIFSVLVVFYFLGNYIISGLEKEYSKPIDITFKLPFPDEILERFNLSQNAPVEIDKVVISGFGTFVIRGRKARVGRNPKTGDSLNLPQMNTVGFIAAKSMKKAVRR